MKDLAYYMGLNYPVLVRRMEHEDGGYYARFIDFGPANAHGDGATPNEAIAMARESLELTIEAMLEDGIAIPEPNSKSCSS